MWFILQVYLGSVIEDGIAEGVWGPQLCKSLVLDEVAFPHLGLVWRPMIFFFSKEWLTTPFLNKIHPSKQERLKLWSTSCSPL